MFRFSNHPAAITVTEGVRDAWAYMHATWRRWLPVLLVVVVIDAAAATYLATNLDEIVHVNQYNGRVIWGSNAGSAAVALIVLSILEIVVTFVASCYFWGLAIVGLRRTPLTLDWLVARGVLVLASALAFGVCRRSRPSWLSSSWWWPRLRSASSCSLRP